jgi:hypothetical protein
MIEAGRYSLVLADVDIISKLAHWRLLHHLPQAFGCALNQIATLGSLVHRARKAIENPDKLFQDNETANYAFEFLSQLAQLPNPNEPALQALQRIPNIDAGEALLIATLKATENSLLATGDKRALKAIAQAIQKGMGCNIAGRIICLEQLLQCLLAVIGHENWLNSIAKAPGMDTAIRMICGSQCNAPHEVISEGLCSYTDSLRQECGTLLIPT